MKEIKEKKMRRDKEHMAIRRKNKFEDRYAKGIHFDIRSKGVCFITMQRTFMIIISHRHLVKFMELKLSSQIK